MDQIKIIGSNPELTKKQRKHLEIGKIMLIGHCQTTVHCVGDFCVGIVTVSRIVFRFGGFEPIKLPLYTSMMCRRYRSGRLVFLFSASITVYYHG